MSAWMVWLSQYGLYLVFAGAIVEGEMIVLMAGILTHQGVLPYGWTLLVAAAGAFVGDQLWYFAGRRYGDSALQRFPRIARHADRAAPWIQQHADRIAAGSRFMYGVRTVAPMLLGISGYPARRFILVNIASACVWALLVVSLGHFISHVAVTLLGHIEHLEKYLLIAVVLVMSLLWWWRSRKAA